jgi:hypothetical protein
MDLYLQRKGKIFPFRECMVILHDIPKYNPFTAPEDNLLELSDVDEEEEEEGDGGGHNQVPKIQGNKMTNAAVVVCTDAVATELHIAAATTSISTSNNNNICHCTTLYLWHFSVSSTTSFIIIII